MMNVVVISDKRQEFDGVAYYLCGNYYQKKGLRLHRVVWEHHHGKIPPGYHVHHIDGDRSNNNISNLELIEKGSHASFHAVLRPDYNKMHIERIRPLASKWHGSDEGLKWHSKQGKENWAKRKLLQYTCDFCGKTFETQYVYGSGQNHFCHQNCKQKFRNRRLKNEKNQKDKLCREG